MGNPISYYCDILHLDIPKELLEERKQMEVEHQELKIVMNNLQPDLTNIVLTYLK